MRKLATVLAAALIAPTLITATTAPAAAAKAPRDPAAAVKRQAAKKSGVHIKENVRLTLGRETLMNIRQSGLLRLGPRGTTAYDLKFTGAVRMRLIGVHGRTYMQSPELTDELPEGKKWVRLTDISADTGSSIVNVLDPKVLKTLLKTTRSKVSGGRVDGVRTVVYRGSITLRQLAKVAPTARDTADALKTLNNKKPVTVPWKLWVGRDRLPRRLTASIGLETSKERGDAKITSDTRFSGWGTTTPVKAPPAAEVIDIKDLESGKEITERYLIPFTDPYKGLKLED